MRPIKRQFHKLPYPELLKSGTIRLACSCSEFTNAQKVAQFYCLFPCVHAGPALGGGAAILAGAIP